MNHVTDVVTSSSLSLFCWWSSRTHMEGMILTMKKKIAGENLQHNQLHLITNVSKRRTTGMFPSSIIIWSYHVTSSDQEMNICKNVCDEFQRNMQKSLVSYVISESG